MFSIKAEVFKYGILALALLVAVLYLYNKGYTAGKSECITQQIIAQTAHTEKMNTKYDKIEKNAPARHDSAANAKFLLQRAVNNQ